MSLIAIVGPTASGKTAVSIKIAKQLGSIIISADSRSVYRDMDIGTAKPSMSERSGVPHWGFDIVNPGDRYSVWDFKKGAEQLIEHHSSLGESVVIAGGTGLYVDSVVLDYSFPKSRGIFSQQAVEAMSRSELLYYYNKHNISLPKDVQNLRRLQSGLLRDLSVGGKLSQPREGTIVVGISTDMQALKERIKKRADQMVELGVVKETADILSKYNIDGQNLPGNVYPIVAEYIEGSIDLNELKNRIFRADWKLARKQMMWFKRHDFIKWIPVEDVDSYVLGLIE